MTMDATLLLAICPGIAFVLSYLFTDVLNLEMWRK